MRTESPAAHVRPDISVGSTWAAARRAPYWFAATIATVVVADQALDPTRNHVPLCPFHAITGLNCPFCGSLRAAYSLSHGRLVAAAHDNALLLLALPLLAAFWIDWAFRARRGELRRRVPRAAVVAVVITAVAFAVLRNLPDGRALNPA
jgi:hypothetical protein